MNTIVGALVAAMIAGLTAALALLSGENITSVSDISALQWIILSIGIAITFAKDFQTITVRRLVNKVTNSGDGGGSI